MLATVQRLGTQWPRIAAQLRGRTPDAVRNRWHRLRHQQKTAGSGGSDLAAEVSASADVALMVPPHVCDGDALPAASELFSSEPQAIARASFGHADLSLVEAAHAERGVHARACWTAHEDGVIMDGVRRHGCKWRQIAAALPNRSDSSVRNRWVRLQTMARRGELDGAADEQPSPGATSSSGSTQEFPAAAATASLEPQAAARPPRAECTGAPKECSGPKHVRAAPVPRAVGPLPAHRTEDSTAHILVSFASQSITPA